LLGILLAIIGLAIFVLEKSNRGLNGSEGVCVSSAVSALPVAPQSRGRGTKADQRFNFSNFCEMLIFESLRKK
jgi:hypothetical protein